MDAPRWHAPLGLLTAALALGCHGAASAGAAPPTLAEVRAWCLQADGFGRPLAFERLVAAEVDLAVLDTRALPTDSDHRALVRRIQGSPGLARRRKLVLGLVRTTQDVAPCIAAGCDGFYLTGEALELAPTLAHETPDHLRIGAAALAAPEQQPIVRALLPHLDALAVEGLSFGGQRDVPWDDPRGGGVASDEAARERWLALLEEARAYGLPTLTLDLALTSAQRARAVRASAAVGAAPCVTRGPFDRLPDDVFDRSDVF